MKPPKLLPWFARKNGLSDELALKLWRRAVSEVHEGEPGWVASRLDALAMERFIDLCELESGLGGGGIQTAWVWRHQRRLNGYWSVAIVNAYAQWHRNWNGWINQDRLAA